MLQYELWKLFFDELISILRILWPPHHGLLLHVPEESHGAIHTDNTVAMIDVDKLGLSWG